MNQFVPLSIYISHSLFLFLSLSLSLSLFYALFRSLYISTNKSIRLSYSLPIKVNIDFTISLFIKWALHFAKRCEMFSKCCLNCYCNNWKIIFGRWVYSLLKSCVCLFEKQERLRQQTGKDKQTNQMTDRNVCVCETVWWTSWQAEFDGRWMIRVDRPEVSKRKWKQS